MQVDQHVERVGAQRPGLVLVERYAGREVAARDDAVDALHHVELAADDRLVLAERDHLGHQRERVGEAVLDAVLPAHVVRTLGLLAAGRTAQDQVVRTVAQRVGEVGRATTELLHLDVCGQLGALRCQPFAHRLDVEAVLLAHGGSAVELAHPSHRLVTVPSR